MPAFVIATTNLFTDAVGGTAAISTLGFSDGVIDSAGADSDIVQVCQKEAGPAYRITTATRSIDCAPGCLIPTGSISSPTYVAVETLPVGGTIVVQDDEAALATEVITQMNYVAGNAVAFHSVVLASNKPALYNGIAIR